MAGRQTVHGPAISPIHLEPSGTSNGRTGEGLERAREQGKVLGSPRRFRSHQVERLWRTVKYEEVYLKAYASVLEAQRGLEDYFRFYNGLRPHQALGYRTPAEVFHQDQGIVVEGDSKERRGSPGQGTESLAGEPGFSLNSPLILSK